MNHQLNKHQHLVIPVNYPKNPDQTTMNEATHIPPKSSNFKLNFPVLNNSLSTLLRTSTRSLYVIMRRLTASGSSILSFLLRYSARYLKPILAPVIILLIKGLEIVNSKFIQSTEDFFSFMDSFFLMDEQDLELQPIMAYDANNEAAQVAEENVNRSFGFNPVFASFIHASSRKQNQPDLEPAFQSGYQVNYSSFMDSSKLAFKKQSKTITAFSSLINTFNHFKNDINKFIPKLPFKTQWVSLQNAFSSFNFLYFDRAYHFIDALILGENSPNLFAHDE